eukprot:6214432-Pleurochrysis_carterae.AAC.3
MRSVGCKRRADAGSALGRLLRRNRAVGRRRGPTSARRIWADASGEGVRPTLAAGPEEGGAGGSSSRMVAMGCDVASCGTDAGPRAWGKHERTARASSRLSSGG